jgi:hypothetical protein
MQLMVLNMQLMQANGAGGVLLPGGDVSSSSTKKGESSAVPTTSTSTSTSNSSSSVTLPPTSAIGSSTSSIAAAQVPSKQGKKRPAPVNVTEVGTATAETLNELLGGFARQINAIPPSLASSSSSATQLVAAKANKSSSSTTASITTGSSPLSTGATKTEVVGKTVTPPPVSMITQPMMQPSQSTPQVQKMSSLKTSSLSQLSQPPMLLPTHTTNSSSSSMVPPLPFQPMTSSVPSSMGSDSVRHFSMGPSSSSTTSSNGNGVNTTTNAASSSTPLNTFNPPCAPSSDSILSLFPYGLPSHLNSLSNGQGNNNNNNGNNHNPPPMPPALPPLSAAQLSQMFGLLQNTGSSSSSSSLNSGSSSTSNNNNPFPFLGFLPPPPPHFNPNMSSFPNINSLGNLSGPVSDVSSCCPPLPPTLPR